MGQDVLLEVFLLVLCTAIPYTYHNLPLISMSEFESVPGI